MLFTNSSLSLHLLYDVISFLYKEEQYFVHVSIVDTQTISNVEVMLYGARRHSSTDYIVMVTKPILIILVF